VVRPLPIRLRLTLAFAVAMTVLLASAGAFLYLRLASELRASTDALLRAQADVLVSSIGQGETAFGDTAGPAVHEGQPFAQILGPDGRIVESSEPVAGAPLLSASELGSLAQPAFFERPVRGVEGVSRLFARSMTDRGRPLFVVVGTSLSNHDEILSRFLLLLVIGGPIALALACAGGWLIAGAALRPVERMRREAAAITVSDRSHRLPVPATGDEIARLGSTLNSMLDRLQQAFDRERRFVDDASHELRTPLTILKAELDLATSRSRTREEIEAALGSASEEADRLAMLAQDLLVYSRADAGRVPVHREEVRIDTVIRDACRSFAARAGAMGVRIDVEAPELTAELDAARLRQALSNVIDNALRHTTPGGSIRVVATGEPDAVRVIVDDDGSGFDPDLVPTAFEPFARGAVERATAAPGAGLGLAIVQAVAHAHGGAATIENRPEGGARVTLVLPRSG
jgi:two-component system, OmpR family, sensor kinase